MLRRRRIPRTRPALAVAVALSGCSATAPATPTRTVVVSAAASLTDAFGALAAAFEQEHDDVTVTLNLASSSTLREQVLAGAPVDVFAPADEAAMAPVVDAGLAAGDPLPFATNRLTIAVPTGNPAGIVGLADLADPDHFIGLCAEGVPCGDLAARALDAAGVTASVDTREPDVRALLTKVATGELDAGITYVTDVVADSMDVGQVPIPSDVNPVATYPIVVLRGASSPGDAAAFVDFVLSPTGQELLRTWGFGPP